jgi:hypothetical protein
MRFIPRNYKNLINEHIPLHDMEGEMVITQCKAIVEKANAILAMMKPETQLEAWVQSKITLADDYVGCVHDYLKNNKNSKE